MLSPPNGQREGTVGHCNCVNVGLSKKIVSFAYAVLPDTINRECFYKHVFSHTAEWGMY